MIASHRLYLEDGPLPEGLVIDSVASFQGKGLGGRGGGPKDMTQGVLSSGTEAEIRASLKE